MLTVTESAREQVLQYFEGEEIQPVRIFSSSGCSGPQLALAVDATRSEDAVFTFGDVTIIIEPSLLEQAGAIMIDATSEGFVIDSEIKPAIEAGCGGCSSAGKCG